MFKPSAYFQSIKRLEISKAGNGMVLTMAFEASGNNHNNLLASLKENVGKPIQGKDLSFSGFPISNEFQVVIQGQRDLGAMELATLISRLNDQHVINQQQNDALFRQMKSLSRSGRSI